MTNVPAFHLYVTCFWYHTAQEQPSPGWKLCPSTSSVYGSSYYFASPPSELGFKASWYHRYEWATTPRNIIITYSFWTNIFKLQVWHNIHRHFSFVEPKKWPYLDRRVDPVGISWLDLTGNQRIWWKSQVSNALNLVLFVIYFTLNGTIISKMNIMLYCRRLKARGRDYRLIWNLFVVGTSQVRSRVIFS